MRGKSFVLGMMAFGVLAAAPALAEEIIYFTNGSSLPIRSHVVEGDMIKVDLGNDGFIAFPNSVVDKIVQADDDVVLGPSLSNKIEGSDSNRVYATPAPQRDSWALPDEAQTPSVVITDSKGVAVVPVFPGTDNAGRAKMMSANTQGVGATANQSAERRGVGSIIQGDPAQGPDKRRKLYGISPKRR